MPTDFAALADVYRKALLEDIVPFWAEHLPDWEHGGYHDCLARDGSVYWPDKHIRSQARATWLFSRLYNRVEPRQEWLDLARLGYDFLMRCGFDKDGQLFDTVTEDGQPLVRSRPERLAAHGALAFSEYAVAAGEDPALETARQLFQVMIDTLDAQGGMPPERLPEDQRGRALDISGPFLAVCQQLRQIDDNMQYDELWKRAAAAAHHYWAMVEEKTLFGTTFMWPAELFWPDARVVGSGDIAAQVTSVMEEGARRRDMSMVYAGAHELDFGLTVTWDLEYGGFFCRVDADSKAPLGEVGDTKLWWPQCEMLVATLSAYKITGERRYRDWFLKVHDWTFGHFPDAEFGEWFGYLHRDGSVADTTKGGCWRSTYHLPRCLLRCWKLLEEITATTPATSPEA